MSPIGRIFIVLNLILSAAFLGWAANALGTTADLDQQLKDAKAAHVAEIAAKDDEISTLTGKNDELENNARNFREQRDQLQASSDSLQTQLDDSRRQGSQLEAQLTSIAASLSDYNDTIAQMTQQKDASMQRAHEAERERDDAVAKAQAAELARRDAEESSSGSAIAIGDLETTRAKLQAEIASLETRLETLVTITGVDPNQVIVQPQIEAAVLNVRHDMAPGLVTLNVGSDKEVKRGYTFEVYRGGQYKGQVRVENVQGNMCSAVITRTVPGTTMAQGDRAATHL